MGRSPLIAAGEWQREGSAVSLPAAKGPITIRPEEERRRTGGERERNTSACTSSQEHKAGARRVYLAALYNGEEAPVASRRYILGCVARQIVPRAYRDDRCRPLQPDHRPGRDQKAGRTVPRGRLRKPPVPAQQRICFDGARSSIRAAG